MSARCARREGTAVVTARYEPPASARDCYFSSSPGAGAELSSITLENEADFLQHFSCPEGAASGIDFASQRLRATVLRELGFGDPPAADAAVLSAGAIYLDFVLSPYCGGAYPPDAIALTLLPVGDLPIVDETCTNGSCGADDLAP